MSLEHADHGGLRHVYQQTISALVTAAGQRDRTAEGHSQRVTRYSVAIGRSMGLSGPQLDDLRYAAGLHDIGKVAISRRIINKLGRLSHDEFEVMKQHSLLSIRILEKIDGLREASNLVKHHHERYDGKGYPDGLAADSIPLGSRIIAVAEAFDILTSDVPWRDALEQEYALREIEACAGTQFDPTVTAALRAAIVEGFVEI
jgi:HD-GYP domain-containing protein (c-di-GMP phosphodiesterase class II)